MTRRTRWFRLSAAAVVAAAAGRVATVGHVAPPPHRAEAAVLPIDTGDRSEMVGQAEARAGRARPATTVATTTSTTRPRPTTTVTVTASGERPAAPTTTGAPATTTVPAQAPAAAEPPAPATAAPTEWTWSPDQMPDGCTPDGWKSPTETARCWDHLVSHWNWPSKPALFRRMSCESHGQRSARGPAQRVRTKAGGYRTVYPEGLMQVVDGGYEPKANLSRTWEKSKGGTDWTQWECG